MATARMGTATGMGVTPTTATTATEVGTGTGMGMGAMGIGMGVTGKCLTGMCQTGSLSPVCGACTAVTARGRPPTAFLQPRESAAPWRTATLLLRFVWSPLGRTCTHCPPRASHPPLRSPRVVICGLVTASFVSPCGPVRARVIRSRPRRAPFQPVGPCFTPCLTGTEEYRCVPWRVRVAPYLDIVLSHLCCACAPVCASVVHK